VQIAKYDEVPWSRTIGSRGGGSLTYAEAAEDKKPGNRFKRMFCGEDGEPGNFEVAISRTVTSQEVKHYPRHHHIFDQFRMTLVGEPEWTPNVATPEGWMVYVSAGTWYGPYDRQAGHETLHLQYEGMNCPPFPGYQALMKARDILAKKGSFGNGIYSWVDENGGRHNQDGHEANLQQATGQPVVYPKPRFPVPINLDPDSFGWIENGPGVLTKEIATFSEGETRVALVKLDGDAKYRFEAPDQRTLLFVHGGTGAFDNEPMKLRDCALLTPFEACDISTDELVEVLVFGFPKIPNATMGGPHTVTAGQLQSAN
jgi:hypothetical protein